MTTSPIPTGREDSPHPPVNEAAGTGTEDRGDILDCLRENNSLAIVGRDGTGKSVFALHLASMYHSLHHYATRPAEKKKSYSRTS